MPAPATSRKSACGRLAQSKICSGNPLNSSQGELGTNVMKVAAPIATSGAASPRAREMARITPVIIPGSAAGKT